MTEEHMVRVTRRGAEVRLTLKGMTNHELREVLVGLWARLDPDDRADHIAELQHYAEFLADPAAHPGRHLSPLARVIALGGSEPPGGESVQ